MFSTAHLTIQYKLWFHPHNHKAYFLLTMLCLGTEKVNQGSYLFPHNKCVWHTSTWLFGKYDDPSTNFYLCNWEESLRQRKRRMASVRMWGHSNSWRSRRYPKPVSINSAFMDKAQKEVVVKGVWCGVVLTVQFKPRFHPTATQSSSSVSSSVRAAASAG